MPLLVWHRLEHDDTAPVSRRDRPFSVPQFSPLTVGELLEFAQTSRSSRVAVRSTHLGNSGIEPHIVRALGDLSVDAEIVFAGAAGELASRLRRIVGRYRDAYRLPQTNTWSFNYPAILGHLAAFLEDRPGSPAQVFTSQVYVSDSAQYRLNEGSDWREEEPSMQVVHAQPVDLFGHLGKRAICKGLKPNDFIWQGGDSGLYRVLKPVVRRDASGVHERPRHELLGPLRAFPSSHESVPPIYVVVRDAPNEPARLVKWRPGLGLNPLDIVHHQHALSAFRIAMSGVREPMAFVESLHFVYCPESGALAFVEAAQDRLGGLYDSLRENSLFGEWVLRR